MLDSNRFAGLLATDVQGCAVAVLPGVHARENPLARVYPQFRGIGLLVRRIGRYSVRESHHVVEVRFCLPNPCMCVVVTKASWSPLQPPSPTPYGHTAWHGIVFANFSEAFALGYPIKDAFCELISIDLLWTVLTVSQSSPPKVNSISTIMQTFYAPVNVAGKVRRKSV